MTRPASPGVRAAVPLVALLAVALLAAALLAACGGSSGGGAAAATATPFSSSPDSPTPAASATNAAPGPTPVPSPHVTTWPPPTEAVALMRRFWNMVGDGRLEQAQRTIVAPGSDILTWQETGIRSAHYLRLLPDSVQRRPVDDATVEFGVVLWVVPSTEMGAWGETGEHVRFDSVVRMSDGTWRMWSSGTGP